jgi:hypothetical protein
VARSADVTEQPHEVMLLGERWVVYRSDGEVRAFADRCPPSTLRASPITTAPIPNWRSFPLQNQHGESVVAMTQSR